MIVIYTSSSMPSTCTWACTCTLYWGCACTLYWGCTCALYRPSFVVQTVNTALSFCDWDVSARSCIYWVERNSATYRCNLQMTSKSWDWLGDITYYMFSWVLSRQAHDVHPMLGWCWASIEAGGPTLTQHWVTILCLLELCCLIVLRVRTWFVCEMVH